MTKKSQNKPPRSKLRGISQVNKFDHSFDSSSQQPAMYPQSLNKPNKLLLKILIVLIILCLTVLTTAYFVINNQPKDTVELKKNVDETQVVDATAQTVAEHTLYNSNLFNYSVDYPQTLSVREMGSGGGYIDFVKFEEAGKGTYKGFAVGVSEQAFNDEIVRIKKLFDEDDNAYLSEEKTVNYNGLRTKRLYYKPHIADNGDEERVVVIFSDGRYTYSISTVPDQIDDVLSRFSFIN